MHGKTTRFARRCAWSAIALAGLSPLATWASEPATVTAVPTLTFLNTPVGMRVGQLVWQGGFSFTSDVRSFGGISGIAFLDSERFVAVGDRGSFISGRMLHTADGFPLNLIDVRISPILDEDGQVAEDAKLADAEAIEVVRENGEPVLARVGFERLTRVADYELQYGRPVGSASPVAIPQWMAEISNNDSIESVCIATPRSPVAGQTLVITENFERDSDNRAAALIGPDGYKNLDLAKQSGIRPTDCAFLPNGDLLVLLRDERGSEPAMQIRRISASDVREGAIMNGPLLIEAGSPDVRNMEGLGVRMTEAGEVRIVVVSDNGYSKDLPSILLEFSLLDMTL